MRYFSLFNLWILLFFASSCSQSNSPYKLRTFHTSPDLGAFKLTVDDKEHAEQLSYAEVTPYKAVNKKILDYKAYNEQEELLFAISHTFSQKGDYTLVVSGYSNDLDFIIIDDEKPEINSNQTAMRFWNGVLSSSAYDIYVTLPGSGLNEATIDFLNFDYATASTYLKLTSGSYQVRITEPGSTSNLVANEIMSFSAGKVYTIALIEKAGGGTPYELVVLEDNSLF
ncbi:DUF4397 domain-containing protein [bacterium]|nr:DUF4397 domain-containing protein [bacterium]